MFNWLAIAGCVVFAGSLLTWQRRFAPVVAVVGFGLVVAGAQQEISTNRKMIEQTAIVAAEPQFDPLCKEAIAEDAINLPDLPKFWIGPDRASWRSDAVHVVAHWSYGALDKAKAAGQLYCDVNVRDRSAKATFIRNWNSPLAYPGKDQLAR